MRINSFTALDAAFPGYIISTNAIKRGDAKFIDAIHTNAGIRGKYLPFADVDFYANGGTFQPPCSTLSKYACKNEILCQKFKILKNEYTSVHLNRYHMQPHLFNRIVRRIYKFAIWFLKQWLFFLYRHSRILR